MRQLCLLLLTVSLLAIACVPHPRLVLPDGPGFRLPDYQGVFEASMTSCREVRTMEMELSISGRNGERRLRGRVRSAFERPASVRLEGLTPFGPLAFVLVTETIGEALLVLPRDGKVIVHDNGADLIEGLTGIDLSPDDFRAVLTGCLVPNPSPVSGRFFGNDWRMIELEGNAAIFLRLVNGSWVVVAGERSGMTVEYSDHVRGLPRRVQLLATNSSGVITNIVARLSQVSINVELHDDVFLAPIRDDYETLTLEQFRGAIGPLETPLGNAVSPQ